MNDELQERLRLAFLIVESNRLHAQLQSADRHTRPALHLALLDLQRDIVSCSAALPSRSVQDRAERP